jgi:protein import protein ZIM17
MQRRLLLSNVRKQQPSPLALIDRRLPMHVRFSTNNDNISSGNDDAKTDIKIASSSSSTTMDESISVTINPAPDLQIPGAQSSSRKLAIVFTCTVCNTRSAKQFSEAAYQKGVVLVQCPGCKNRHLIADRLGIFQDGHFDVDTIAAITGQSVTKIGPGDMELQLQDLVGSDKMKEILQAAAAGVQGDGSNSNGKDPQSS